VDIMMEWAKDYPRSAELAENHIRKERLLALNFLDISDQEKDAIKRHDKLTSHHTRE
jgi:hypothetical protein